MSSRDPAAGLKSLYEVVRSRLSSAADGGEGGDSGEEWGPPVLLVDDVSVLLSLGVSAGAVLDFSHYCRATVCTRLKVRRVVPLRFCSVGSGKIVDKVPLTLEHPQGNVVMLTRCDGEEQEDEGDDEGAENLLRGLTHQCTIALHARGLPTGFCRDIHGQVCVGAFLRSPWTSVRLLSVKVSGNKHLCFVCFQVEVCWRQRHADGQCTPSKIFQYKVHDKGATFFARGTSSAVL